MDNFIELVVIGIACIVVILVFVLVVMTLKERAKKKEEENAPKKVDDELEERKAQKSIFKFMEFDTIEDNMIVQDNGKRYLMVIECKGINYDLLSAVERNSVEMGFISFLNTLKYEIQLYVQTRKVNLLQSTAKYRERLKMIELDMNEEEHKYQEAMRLGNVSNEEMLRLRKEATKKRNLYEYTRDIIENTEKMSEDSDLTTKEYYIVVPYYTDDITGGGDYDKREISSMAFTELYTRAQSLASGLNECDVRGRILNSQELIELLFISYNREQHDTYDFEEYIGQSGFNSFYSVSEDVLQKRIRALDEEIARRANDKSIEALKRVNRRKEDALRAIKEREDNMEQYVDLTAEALVDTQTNVLGKSVAEATKEELKAMRNEKIVGATVDVETEVEEAPKKKRELTPEEKARRKALILKKRRLLKEREAKKNEQN